MRLKRKVDELEALINARFDSVEEALKRIIARGEIVSVIERQLKDEREEKKELLDRLMARDFESYKTYTAEEGLETVGEDIKPEEDPDMAGEVFEVPETTT